MFTIKNTPADPNFDYQFRFILIGDSTVGKSSLLKFFTDGRFSEICDPTVGVDFYAKIVEVKPGVRIKLQLWDTAGQERFRSITRSYYRNSVGGLLLYDITKRSSFDSIPEWLYEAQYHIAPQKGVFLLVGHKSDLSSKEREVSYEEGKEFAEHHGITFLETSARTGQNVETAFLTATKEIYRQLEEGDLKLQDGWDGIKLGYGRRSNAQETVPIYQGQEEHRRESCCS